MQCCLAVQQSQDGSLGLHTDGGLVNCAVLHNHQSGNGHYTELGSQLGLLVYIDLTDLDIVTLVCDTLYLLSTMYALRLGFVVYGFIISIRS